MSSNQSILSFEEQKHLLQLNTKNIDKYSSKTEVDYMACTKKNMTTFGSPGTGKSYLGELTILYAFSLGLNTITSSLMGVRANALGGKHVHIFQYQPMIISVSSPFKFD